ncbi:MAG TPA: hypothetical protein VF679_06925 [Pedobacter sp.]|jgi:hypothetical protein
MNISETEDESTNPQKGTQMPAKTVRGSGFTYDEEKNHTDESIPLDQVEEEAEIVKLPDLGMPNRP